MSLFPFIDIWIMVGIEPRFCEIHKDTNYYKNL